MMRYKSIGRHRRPYLRKLLLREKTTKLGIALVSHCSFSFHHHHHIGSDKGRVTVPKGSKAVWNFSENSSVLVLSPVPFHQHYDDDDDDQNNECNSQLGGLFSK